MSERSNGHHPERIVFHSAEQATASRPQRRQPSPIVDSLREVQAIQAAFSNNTLNGERTPQQLFGMLKDESAELEEAIEKDDRVEIASELADIVIFAANLADHYNIHLDIAVSDKLERNGDKYNPAVIEQLKETGMTPPDAMKQLKGQWNRDKDKEYSRINGIRAELAELIAAEPVATNGHNGHSNGHFSR